MTRLLSKYTFKNDKQSELLEAFKEIDNDADGFISKTEIRKYMVSLGEPLESDELDYLLELAQDPNNPNSEDIDIQVLA